jgi:hypothetical protein
MAGHGDVVDVDRRGGLLQREQLLGGRRRRGGTLEWRQLVDRGGPGDTNWPDLVAGFDHLQRG